MKPHPNVCFLLLTHRSSEQVRRIVEAVSPCPVLVHVDARADRQVWSGFQDLAERYAQVELVPRQTTGWASWGLVQATINGLECSLGLDCTHVVKMTGQDYPLRPIEVILAFFDENRDMSVDPPRRDPR